MCNVCNTKSLIMVAAEAVVVVVVDGGGGGDGGSGGGNTVSAVDSQPIRGRFAADSQLIRADSR